MLKTLIAICLLLIIIFFISCSSINKDLGLKDDNLGEQIIEDVIKMEIGLDIDLTPNFHKEK